MIARVEDKGNNTNDYYEAGVNIIPSLPLGGINPDTCGVDCLKDKLTMETMTGKWRGWQVCILKNFKKNVCLPCSYLLTQNWPYPKKIYCLSENLFSSPEPKVRSNLLPNATKWEIF